MFKKTTIKSKQFVRKREELESSDDEGKDSSVVFPVPSNFTTKVGKTKKNSEEISVNYKSQPEPPGSEKNAMEQPRNVIRTTIQYDYQPDVCKDYKETGYCGFGDSCKFLHDRSDYKFGWQLNNVKDDADDAKFEIDSDKEDLPSTCPICREDFVDMVITRCKHHFCEKCALENFKKSTRCFVCDTPTGGIFNVTKSLQQNRDGN